MKEVATQNWRLYEDKDGQPQGHLLTYPIDVCVSIQEGVSVVTLIAMTKVVILQHKG